MTFTCIVGGEEFVSGQPILDQMEERVPPHLQQERNKWQQPKRNLMTGDVVILREENAPRNMWPLGLVVDTEPDSRGFVRTVIVKTKENVYKRPVSKIVLLLATDH